MTTHIEKAIEAAWQRLSHTVAKGATGLLAISRADLAAAIEKYEAAMWAPIADAPKDGTLWHVWNGRNVQRAFWDKVDCAWVLAFKTTTKRMMVVPLPTHFRPIPSAPKGE